jgi:hypothetical protein
VSFLALAAVVFGAMLVYAAWNDYSIAQLALGRVQKRA